MKKNTTNTYSIEVNNLTKHFKSTLIPTNFGLKGLFRYLFPLYKKITAVNSINFKINQGERVAFIGPNGAGKSTTMKILTGISQPSSGNVKILGKDPVKERNEITYKLGAVFGQTSQLWQDLPVKDSFDLLAAIYEVSKKNKETQINHLSNLFNITDFLHKEVRQLSLGQRMRCEIVASLLHNPSILFLDEPTIGLDITAKAIIRDLVKKLTKEQNKTLLLTSHDTDDIEKVCDRVIIMNKGEIVFDDSLINLKNRHIKKKIVSVITENENIIWNKEGTKIIDQKPYNTKIEIDLKISSTKKVISSLISDYSIKDLIIENPPLEDIIEQFYN